MLQGLYLISANNIRVNHDINWGLVKGEVCNLWTKYMKMNFNVPRLYNWFLYDTAKQEAWERAENEFPRNHNTIG